MKAPVGGPPAARHWQAVSDLDTGGRRRMGLPVGFVLIGCFAAVTGLLLLVFKWAGSASPFGRDVIAGISQALPDPGAGASAQPAVAASDVEPTSFVGLSSRGAAAGIAAPHAATAGVDAGPPPAAAASPSASVPAMSDEAARTADVIDSLSRWAAAWSRRDVDAYLASYVDDFTGRTQPPSREAWERDRRQKILSKSSIAVGVSGLSVQTHNELAVVRFTQRYQADQLQFTHHKLVTLRLQRGRWLIQEETELP